MPGYLQHGFPAFACRIGGMKMTEKKKWLKRFKNLSAGAVLAGSLVLGAGMSACTVSAGSYVEPGEVFPVSVSITGTQALGDVYLPAGAYGDVVWVSPGEVPPEGTSYHEVKLIPEDWVDITELDGYDPDRGGVYKTIAVYVEADKSSGTALPLIHDSSVTEPQVTEPEGFILNDTTDLAAPDMSLPEDFVLNNQQTLVDPDMSLPADFVLNNQQTLVNPDMSLPDDFVLKDSDTAGPAPDTSLPAGFYDTSSAPELIAPDVTDPHDQYGADFYTVASTQLPQLGSKGSLSAKGVTVAGDNIPEYVSLEVSGGSASYFSTASQADYFESYDLMLWDNNNGQEYVLGEGQTAYVSIPVKEGYVYQVEHVRGDGTVEILPSSLNGNVLSFATDSFSSFGIAGSYPVSGQATDAVDETVAPTGAAAPAQNTSASTPASSGSIAGSTSVNTGSSVNTGTVSADTPAQVLKAIRPSFSATTALPSVSNTIRMSSSLAV